MCVHRQPAYRARCAGMTLPVSEAVSGDSVILPLFPHMTDEEHAAVCAALQGIDERALSTRSLTEAIR
jgi:dTDP-4-amino-4,6-dideoxygalactose transaminase